MKRLSIISLLLFLGFATVSCNKEKKGYTIDDIVGEYIFSNAADAFDGLEADENTFICYDAVITIARDGENSVDFWLSCPNEDIPWAPTNEGHKARFNGAPFQNENDSVISMSYDYGYGKYPPNESMVIANVSKMDGKIRLQGYHYFYSGSSALSYFYYFDVLKK